MSREARSRVLLGLGIPLGALVFLGLLIFAFSRLLLAVPVELAPWVALLFATNILVGCALAATIRGTRGFAFLITLLVGTIVGGGIAGAVVGERPVHSLVAEGEHQEGVPPPEGAPPPESPAPAESPAAEESPPPPGEEPGGGGGGAIAEIAAQGIAFDTSELSLPDEPQVTIAFDNQDSGIPHNVAVYTAEGGDPILTGEIITGPAQVDYTFDSPGPGTYYYQCDVHPTMNGSLTIG
jgi:plastocyanin